ncbi:MAG TPA: SDR family oxidoreductase [Gammaproteobacteria bacterium]|jgi:NAD(P)-dependent dehydrogenase (short-subunit alcohol dehydrogenase family)|nr:SDR family oxidoreductase [Gammaproteobacteria bacterium]
MNTLIDKVALITGSGSGIGRSAAILFSQAGAKISVADVNAEHGTATVNLIEANGGQAIFVECDVSKPENVRSMISTTVKAFGGLNILYNNAGGSTMMDGRVTEAPDEEFWRVIGLDLYGTFLGCKYAIPELIKAGGGSVINMSSNQALMGVAGRICYTAAKGGIASMTRAMAVEYGGHKIRVNAIAPSVTLTERVKKLLEQSTEIQKQAERHLVGLAEPEDVANLALYLASDQSALITGQVISVDSGVTIS